MATNHINSRHKTQTGMVGGAKNIYVMLLKDFRCQFHQRFTRSFFANILVPKIYKAKPV